MLLCTYGTVCTIPSLKNTISWYGAGLVHWFVLNCVLVPKVNTVRNKSKTNKIASSKKNEKKIPTIYRLAFSHNSWGFGMQQGCTIVRGGYEKIGKMGL